MPDVEALRQLRKEGVPALLYGPPGTGKTSLVETAFPDLITVAGDGDTTTGDFVGEYTQKPDGRYKGSQHADGQKLIARLAASGCQVIWIAPSGTANTMTGTRVVILADPAATSAAIARTVTAHACTAGPPAAGGGPARLPPRLASPVLREHPAPGKATRIPDRGTG